MLFQHKLSHVHWPLVDGHALISTDILARYAGDAAREVPGVEGSSAAASIGTPSTATTERG